MQVVSPKSRHLLVLGTGGTIAGEAGSRSDNVGYKAAQRSVDDLLAGLPLPAGCAVRCEQVLQLDSKDMDADGWQRLLWRLAEAIDDPEVQGIVVTHGTDTLEETAYLLHALLPDTKPVVLTCAMRPATALMSDGPQNLVDALAVAADPAAAGVCVVCAGVIHDPVSVQKVHTYRPDAFDSGDSGPMGHVREGCPVWGRTQAGAAARFSPAVLKAVLACPAAQWPWVVVLLSHGGVCGTMLEAVLAQGGGLAGVVLAGTGNGTLNRALDASLHSAAQRGVRIWRSSRCVHGPVLGHGQGWPIAAGLNPVKARLSLMLTLLAERAGLAGDLAR
ncbi:MAG: asparaginase [Curvibacter sp.]|nr:asparaginase [Curvibacter sp.]